MGDWMWVILAIMAVIIVGLVIKVYLLQKAADEMEAAFAARLLDESNTLLDISSRDAHMRKLATSLNKELATLRKTRHRYQQGDLELKRAVTNISHDLRTPLTAIFGYLDLLEQETLSETATEYTAILRDRAELMKQLTEELFRYSIITTMEQEMDVGAVVVNDVLEESIAAFYTALHEKNITPTIHLPETKVVRELDRNALSRVFGNLLQNAVKYSQGDLDIALTEEGRITFRNVAPDISGIEAGRLFDRFYTVEAARQSTGLGLAIARTLVEQMGGEMGATYESSRLCIYVLFPAGAQH